MMFMKSSKALRICLVGTAVFFVMSAISSYYSFPSSLRGREGGRGRDGNLAMMMPNRGLQQQTPHYRPAPIDVKLPSFEKGGIMVLYHIYKTGGSTASYVMNNIADEDPEEEQFYFRRWRKQVTWQDMQKAVRIASGGKTVMIELHIAYPSPEYPSLVEVAPMLNRWRSAAEEEDVPFFALTILRDPVKHAVSFFNFFHINEAAWDYDWNPLRHMEPTEEDFMSSLVADRQCHMLDADPESILRAPKSALRDDTLETYRQLQSDPRRMLQVPHRNGLVRGVRRHFDWQMGRRSFCRIGRVREALFESLDWVGTTEDLQTMTLPLMTQILLDDPEVGRKTKSEKVFTEYARYEKAFSLKDLSEANRAKLERKTQVDRKLYEEVLARFRYPLP